MGEKSEKKDVIEVSRAFKIGVVLQAVSAGLVGAGIAIEVAYHADAGYLLMSLGSFVFGIASKLMRI